MYYPSAGSVYSGVPNLERMIFGLSETKTPKSQKLQKQQQLQQQQIQQQQQTSARVARAPGPLTETSLRGETKKERGVRTSLLQEGARAATMPKVAQGENLSKKFAEMGFGTMRGEDKKGEDTGQFQFKLKNAYYEN